MTADTNGDDGRRCGLVAVVGRPNAGKSTLINTILGEPLQIVTSMPQTTRNRVLAVHIAGPAQIVFLDTPGIHDPRHALGSYMVEVASRAISEADLSLWIVDAARAARDGFPGDEDRGISTRLSEAGSPVLVLINKIDLLRDKRRLLPLIAALGELGPAAEVFPISARDGEGLDPVLEETIRRLPRSPWLFPEEMVSDRAERFFVEEIIRAAVIELTRQEVPHRCAVVVDRFVEESERCVIDASIRVEKTSQRGIVIGRGGRLIREIGSRSRAVLQERLGCPVELRLHVEVDPNWTDRRDRMREAGYE
ncbi:MAG: GTPase Era [Polyangia bacterium]